MESTLKLTQYFPAAAKPASQVKDLDKIIADSRIAMTLVLQEIESSALHDALSEWVTAMTSSDYDKVSFLWYNTAFCDPAHFVPDLAPSYAQRGIHPSVLRESASTAPQAYAHMEETKAALLEQHPDLLPSWKSFQPLVLGALATAAERHRGVDFSTARVIFNITTLPTPCVVECAALAPLWCDAENTAAARFALWEIQHCYSPEYFKEARHRFPTLPTEADSGLHYLSDFLSSNSIVLKDTSLRMAQYFAATMPDYVQMHEKDIEFCKAFPKLTTPALCGATRIQMVREFIEQNGHNKKVLKFFQNLSTAMRAISGWMHPLILETAVDLCNPESPLVSQILLDRSNKLNKCKELATLCWMTTILPDRQQPDPLETLESLIKQQEKLEAILTYGSRALEIGAWRQFSDIVIACSGSVKQFAERWDEAIEKGNPAGARLLHDLATNPSRYKKLSTSTLLAGVNLETTRKALSQLNEAPIDELREFAHTAFSSSTQGKPPAQLNSTSPRERRPKTFSLEALAHKHLPEHAFELFRSHPYSELLLNVSMKLINNRSMKDNFLALAKASPEIIISEFEQALILSPSNIFKRMTSFIKKASESETPGSAGETEAMSADEEHATAELIFKKFLELNPGQIRIASAEFNHSDVRKRYEERLDKDLFRLHPIPPETSSRPVDYTFQAKERPLVIYHMRQSRHSQTGKSLSMVRGKDGFHLFFLDNSTKMLECLEAVQRKIMAHKATSTEPFS